MNVLPKYRLTGQWLIFHCHRADLYTTVYKVRIDGSELTEISEFEDFIDKFSISSDGSRLLYIRDADLKSMSLSSKIERSVMPVGSGDIDFSYSFLTDRLMIYTTRRITPYPVDSLLFNTYLFEDYNNIETVKLLMSENTRRVTGLEMSISDDFMLVNFGKDMHLINWVENTKLNIPIDALDWQRVSNLRLSPDDKYASFTMRSSIDYWRYDTYKVNFYQNITEKMDLITLTGLIWSPTGERIAYVIQDDSETDSYKIMVSSVDENYNQQIINIPCLASLTSWVDISS